MKKKIFEGLLFPWAETGTEGWLWALQENYKNEYWSYNDLHVIKNNDHLIIYDPDGAEIWSGTIELKYNENYMAENIHTWPCNFDKKEWLKIFRAANNDSKYEKVYTAKLTRHS